ncbi:NEDD8-activating enzyme E1 catalytic subunit-like [Paramacrobiotus metropolitanus]|uniref:NEDD8-activating enzyme E1 catalytic subunit-like n=1 Tax=Paramacrobiotus metropolitanus TaxID=2943436 RepID=UPI002445C23E|nr:NEDD8-activating enzyme E1 catalytic subunit-like [Paramacrobiotus metropolitanus]XP_055337996.1 NEDD8-activating enzyme E1 catalytic subunit-like [Paramacrobiotus metropolitanus]
MQKMASEEIDSGDDDFNMNEFSGTTSDSRLRALNNLLQRPMLPGLALPDFEGCPELVNFMRENCKILVVGAGGLGCELLKDLALLGFRQLTVIDMDTIDLSNLNRQFLFRPSDIGKSKAECAARFINERVPQCRVEALCNRIEDFDEDFYRGFRIVVCGLDSVVARRWMNGMLLSLLSFDEDSNLDPSTIIPLVDGGTEGFKGNVRVVTPGISACLECSLDLYPPAVNFPMCTIAHTPRLPEHCIEYAKILLWPKEEPFGVGVNVDGDDPQHVTWIWRKAEERAKEFAIQGVTYRLTLGVVKHIIPAVASTNAVVAAICASEVFKIASSMYSPVSNFLSFNDVDGIYTNTFQMERNPDCLACSQMSVTFDVDFTKTLGDFIESLKVNPKFQMRNPAVTASIEGKQRTLYMASLEQQTKGNLEKTLYDLGLKSGQEVVIADITSPAAKVFHLRSLHN